MLVELDGILKETENNTSWRVYVVDKKFNRVDPLDKEVKTEVGIFVMMSISQYHLKSTSYNENGVLFVS